MAKKMERIFCGKVSALESILALEKCEDVCVRSGAQNAWSYSTLHENLLKRMGFFFLIALKTIKKNSDLNQLKIKKQTTTITATTKTEVVELGVL